MREGLAQGSGPELELVDPATGETLARFPEADAATVRKAAEHALLAAREWQGLSAAARGRQLWALGDLVAERGESLARLEAVTAGKPIQDARAEVAAVADMFRYWAGWTDKLEGRVVPVPGGQLNIVLPEPVGVVLTITPWNAPLFTAGWNAAPALACGNAVLLKPSEVTPLSSLVLGKLAAEAGLPQGLLQVLVGRGTSVGSAAIAAPEVRKVAFVGSPAGGQAVAELAARHGKPALLELGGKSAHIVFADADLAAAAKSASRAIFAGCGQSCVAGSRLLVERRIHDEFAAAVAAEAARIRVGMPLEGPQMGPIATRRQHAHVQALLADGLASGAALLAGGGPPASALPPGGNWLAPTVLGGIDPGARAAQEEIFGPVLVTMPFDDEQDAVRLANATRFGLAAAVWTKDVGRAHRVARAVRAGTFWINSYRTIHVSSPFGGFGASGYGRSSGQEAIGEYTESKSIWVPGG